MTGHYIYQRIHTLAGRPLHLVGHLDLVARAFQYIYGGEKPGLDEKKTAKQISEKLRAGRFPAGGSATVMLRLTPGEPLSSGTFTPIASPEPSELSTLPVILPGDNYAMPGRVQGEPPREGADGTNLSGTPGVPDGSAGNGNFPRAVLLIEPERLLLDRGYTLSSLRPGAVSYEYDIPFGAFPTNFQLSSATFFDTLALFRHGMTRSVRRDGDKLLTCGDAPLFGIRGKTVFTAPLIDGAMDSVERRLVIAAATRSNLDFLEDAPRHSELSDFDELFFADAGGITSLSECDGKKFMSLLVARIAVNLPTE